MKVQGSWNEEAVRAQIVALIRRTADSLDEEFPYVTDPQGRWKCLPADQYAGWSGGEWSHGNWFCGFWIGLLWLAFELTDDVDFREEARRWAERMRLRQDDPNSHDIGFLFVPSFVKGFLLTGESSWRDSALAAARVLAGLVGALRRVQGSRSPGKSRSIHVLGHAPDEDYRLLTGSLSAFR